MEFFLKDLSKFVFQALEVNPFVVVTNLKSYLCFYPTKLFNGSSSELENRNNVLDCKMVRIVGRIKRTSLQYFAQISVSI